MRPEEQVPRDWKEARRQRAFVLAAKGWKQRRIAEALGVTEGAVSQWLRGRDCKLQPWRTRPRSGRPLKLETEKLESLPDLLSHGAQAWGFRGEHWSAARVAAVVHRHFGVRYHPRQIRRLLKQLGWSPQMPLQRAAQRDEAAIEQWRLHTWPELKKTP
jgi:transposase